MEVESIMWRSNTTSLFKIWKKNISTSISTSIISYKEVEYNLLVQKKIQFNLQKWPLDSTIQPRSFDTNVVRLGMPLLFVLK